MKRVLFILLFMIMICGCNDTAQLLSTESIAASEKDATEQPIEASSFSDKLSIEPENLTDIHTAILGTYICSNDYYNHPDYFGDIPIITFQKDGDCELLVNYLQGVDTVYGTYIIGDGEIYVVLDLEGTVFIEGNEKYMPDEYTFSIADSGELMIDKGFYGVQDGDTFIRLE